MPGPWSQVGAVVSGLLLAGLLHAQFTFPLRQHEDMAAQLTVEVAEKTAERGLGEVVLTLTITGPLELDVEEPRLGDAAAAWKEQRLPISRVAQDKRAVWNQVIRLKQVKRGPEPVPDVTVRFRSRTDAGWFEEKWIDILRNVRDGTAAPEPPAEGPSWFRRSGFVLLLAVTASLVLLAWVKKRRSGRRKAPLPSDQWALREIARIEKTLAPPLGEAEPYHTQVSFVVRRYLAERFGLRALQQTTAEFLESVRENSHLSEEEQTLLTALFQRCDLAKFARAGTSPQECQHTADMARDLVRKTALRVCSER